MKAALLLKPGPIETQPLVLTDYPAPKPGPKEILIRVKVCGLCHTDLHTVEGEIVPPKLPIIPGHQIVGLVAGKGKEVRRYKEGDRVGVPWLFSTCGKCEYCREGRENLCEEARFTGFHENGGYAQYVTAHAGFAYPLPVEYPDLEAAPLLCAGIIGFRALRQSGVKPGERLGLYGFGASAHIALQIARHWSCEVYVFTRSEEHRSLAKTLGAAWAGRAGEEPPQKLHSAILFAPAGELVHDALRALRRGGTVALAGIHMSPIPETEYPLLYHERVLRSVANSTREDAKELLSLAPRVPVRTEVTAFSLEQANQALRLLKESRINGAGALVIPE
jgi:alcohol dehydrogenase, propanol-preferring